MTNIVYHNQEPKQPSKSQVDEENIRSVSMIVENRGRGSDGEEDEDDSEGNYEPDFSLVHSNVLFCVSLLSNSLLISLDILYISRDDSRRWEIFPLTLQLSTLYNVGSLSEILSVHWWYSGILLLVLTVLLCLLQTLLWIDLNKSRKAEHHLVTAKPRSMFREVLVDTADPVVLMLMGPFLRSVSRQIRLTIGSLLYHTYIGLLDNTIPDSNQ